MEQTYRGHTQSELTDLAEALASDHHALWYELVKARRAQGISQAQVAEFLGISQSAVAQFERYDNDPKLSTLRRYALAVGMKLHTTVTPAFGDPPNEEEPSETSQDQISQTMAQEH